MGITDFFKKKKKEEDGGWKREEREQTGPDFGQALEGVDTSKLSFKERMALKMFKHMPRKKQEEVLRKAMNPQEIQKHKEKILKQIDDMVASGQIDKGQAEAVKAGWDLDN